MLAIELRIARAVTVIELDVNQGKDSALLSQLGTSEIGNHCTSPSSSKRLTGPQSEDSASCVKPALWRRLIFNTFDNQHQDDLKGQLAALEAENTRLRLENQVAQQAQSSPGLTAVELHFIRNNLR
ncbi:hypothetical protein ABBQ38_012021 [Trebouxia sp. C0009 RCD-2024]